MREDVVVRIIGGADGPTSIFITGRLGDGAVGGVILAGILAIGISIWIYKKFKK